MRIRTALACYLAVVCSGRLPSAELVPTAWYTPSELLTLLSEREDLRWACPETLAGRALVGEAANTHALLDDACRQWGLAWTKSNGIVVVHRADDERLKTLTAALARGDRAAAWELGWLRDGRAIPPLAAALVSSDVAVALAAAQAIETLDSFAPLGRDERVDAFPAGRVSLAVAFPPNADLQPLLASPYPPLRAAALRLLFAKRGDAAALAKYHTAGDPSAAVRRVRQQLLGPMPSNKPDEHIITALLPLPAPAESEAACAKLVGELPALEKRSEWEQMRWRVRCLAAWSRAGRQPATKALSELCSTKLQFGWFPGYAQMHLAATGSPEATARVREILPKADRDTLVRGLEQSHYGERLLALTNSYLDEPTVCYVTARKAGREALDDLRAWAGRGNGAAIDALGVVGGEQASASLRAQLEKETPGSGTLAFRSAKALGRIGSSESLVALLAASASPDRFRRHAGALFLGQIGGPQAISRLRELLEKETDRLVRAAAVDALEQIGDKVSAEAVAAFRQADASVPPRIFRPRNPRFGDEFPVNQWVNLKIAIQAEAAFGEMGWNYDAANRLFFRYGGCSGYTNELTLLDLGTEQFVQRRPNEEMAGWGDRRASRGCSGGRTWDPFLKVAWIGPVIGGTESDLAITEYYNKGGEYRLCSYDLATDRFRAAAYLDRTYGEPSKRYAYDWQRGLLIPVKFSPFKEEKPFWVIDTKSSDPYAASAWLDRKTTGDYPRDAGYQTAAFDQRSGLLVLYVAPRDGKPAETWTYDPASNTWQNKQPPVQPAGVHGAGFVYEPFQKVLLLQSGKRETQYGGGSDSITWTYDANTNTWTDLNVPSGPGNPWVGAMDFDPEHNVLVLFNHRDRQVWAYRYKQVAVGTRAE